MSFPADGHSPSFPTTSWSLIKRVQKGSEKDAEKAMEQICRQYWYPIYAFTRRSGFGRADAEDMAQTFFQNLVAYDAIRTAQEDKGRLRSFLLAMLKRLISKKIRHDTADKRSGDRDLTFSLDELSAEDRYTHEPATLTNADALFDRAWAEQVQTQATAMLSGEFAIAGNLPLFELIQNFLPFRQEEPASYEAIAARLNIKEGAVRQQVSRMRKRFAKLIEAQIAETVDGETERREELLYLVSLLAG